MWEMGPSHPERSRGRREVVQAHEGESGGGDWELRGRGCGAGREVGNVGPGGPEVGGGAGWAGGVVGEGGGGGGEYGGGRGGGVGARGGGVRGADAGAGGVMGWLPVGAPHGRNGCRR